MNQSRANFEGTQTHRVATIPNAISASRLAIAMALPIVEAEWRLPLLLIGAASDWFDGLFAKLLRSQSVVGQLLDPVADKCLFFSVLVTLIVSQEIGVWQAILVLARDIVVLLAVAMTAAQGRWGEFRGMRPSILGKLTTVIVFGWLVAVIAPWMWIKPLEAPLFAAACACSALAGIGYAARLVRGFSEARKA